MFGISDGMWKNHCRRYHRSSSSFDFAFKWMFLHSRHVHCSHSWHQYVTARDSHNSHTSPSSFVDVLIALLSLCSVDLVKVRACSASAESNTSMKFSRWKSCLTSEISQSFLQVGHVICLPLTIPVTHPPQTVWSQGNFFGGLSGLRNSSKQISHSFKLDAIL